MRSSVRNSGALVVFLVILSASATLIVRGGHVPRAVGLPHVGIAYDNGALGDFRDALYYPGRALLDGHDPYDVAGTWSRYPTTNWLPLYAPDHLLLGVALAVLPFEVAGAVWTVLAVGLLLGVGWLAVRTTVRRPRPAAVLLVAAVMLASRPGRDTFVSGQTTLVYSSATWLAWAWSGAWSRGQSDFRATQAGWATRPWPAAFALAVALTKPPFGIPLLVLLLVLGRGRVAARGVVLCAAGALPVVLAMLATTSGLVRLLADLRGNLAFTTQSVPDRLGGVRRVDAASLLARVLPSDVPDTLLELTTACVVLGLAAVAIRRAHHQQASPALSSAVAAAGIVLSVPHQSYDLLLLAAPLYGLAASRGRLPVALRFAAIVAVMTAAIPAGVLLRLASRPGDLPIVTSATSTSVVGMFLVGLWTVHRWNRVHRAVGID